MKDLSGTVALFAASIAAGALGASLWWAPQTETVDTKAVYCDGYGEGIVDTQTLLHDWAVNIEARNAEQGMRVVVGVYAEDELLDSKALSELVPAPAPDTAEKAEARCQDSTPSLGGGGVHAPK